MEYTSNVYMCESICMPLIFHRFANPTKVATAAPILCQCMWSYHAYTDTPIIML